MFHLFPSASHPAENQADEARLLRPAAFRDASAEADASVAVLITGSGDAAAAVRGFRTVLPRSRIAYCGDDLGTCVAAAATGADVRHVAEGGRDALVRRFFAEVEADVYVLSDGAAAQDLCAAPLAVAEVQGGKDLVGIRRFNELPSPELADRMVCLTADFVFGGWGDLLRSESMVCSRRLVQSYRRTASTGHAGDPSLRDLALHALRLRLPIGRVASLAGSPEMAGPAPARGVADWAERAGIVARLLVEERPRRVFGLLGLALVLAGLAVAAPGLTVYRWHMAFLPGARTLAASALVGMGGLAGATGLLLDALASARQEVGRLGAAAIPRSADPPPAHARGRRRPRTPRPLGLTGRMPDQSSVS